MKILIQKVNKAKLYIEEEFKEKISAGYIIFFGIEKGDDEKLENIIDNLLKIKIVEDEKGYLKKSMIDIKPEIMIIPNITIACKFNKLKPEFSILPEKNKAKDIYEKIKSLFQDIYKENKISKIVYGEFGSHMNIECIISGPINFYLDL